MIRLKPEPYSNFVCPECSSKEANVQQTIFQGIRILADCKCKKCGLEFLTDYPIGHALFYPASLAKKSLKLYDMQNVSWFSKALRYSFMNKNYSPLNIEKKINFTSKNVVLLNCVDYLYGHVLLKLFNAQTYLDNFQDKGLIVIIPKSFGWLVPEGCAEVWLVDIGLNDCGQWFTYLDKFINAEMSRFEQVYLSLAFSNHDFSKINIERFSKIEKFKLPDFLKEAPQITFITREDRLWHTNEIERLLFLLFKKLNVLWRPSLGNVFLNFFLRLQNRKIRRLFKKIKAEIPNAVFNVAGLGKHFKFPAYINDYRVSKFHSEEEKHLCELYSRSHIVIGVHGSNMLLPSAHAAALIELLPKERIGNYLQDVASSHSGQDALFLNRFIDGYASPKKVAETAVSIINEFPEYYLSVSPEFSKHDLYEEVSKWKKYRMTNKIRNGESK